jgi:hypothetical protein
LPPASALIRSPYDVEARCGKKRQTEWTGYKVHLTETCDDELPSPIINVETTDATVTDYEMTPVVQRHLADRGHLPSEHLVDTGYMSAVHLVSSVEQGIDLVGPVAPEKSWQAQAKEDFDSAAFVIDWEAQQAHCPRGHLSQKWQVRAHAAGPCAALSLLADRLWRLPGSGEMYALSHLATGPDHLSPARLRGAARGPAAAAARGVLAALRASGGH